MVERYKVEGSEDIVCQDLTYGFLVGVENGTILDTKVNVIVDGASMVEEDVLNLRKHQVHAVFDIIMRLTYPELYDENGKRIEIGDPEEDTVSKKKL